MSTDAADRGDCRPLQLRQGDVLLVATDALPEDAELEVHDGPIVLAYGEATGHSHVIERGPVTVYSDPAGRLIGVPSVATLVHQEHAPVAVPPGLYRVVIQREYVPAPVDVPASLASRPWRPVVD